MGWLSDPGTRSRRLRDAGLVVAFAALVHPAWELLRQEAEPASGLDGPPVGAFISLSILGPGSAAGGVAWALAPHSQDWGPPDDPDAPPGYADVGMAAGALQALVHEDRAPLPSAPDRTLDGQMRHPFREVALSLAAVDPGNIAVTGFSFADGHHARLLDYRNEAGESQLAAIVGDRHGIVERRRLGAVLQEQELALSDLGSPDQAARIGRFLAASYLLTGTVIEMEETEVIFARLVDVETAAIESIAQVVVPRSVVELVL
jgi:hypothetical protein